MKTLKQAVFTGWHLMRWVRLVIGFFFVIYGMQTADLLMGLVGGFFLLTSIANVGCCGSSCTVRQSTNPDGNR